MHQESRRCAIYSIVDPAVQFIDLRLEMLRVEIDLGELCRDLGVELGVEHPGPKEFLISIKHHRRRGHFERT